MQVIVQGTIAEVEVRNYVDKDGKKRTAFDAHIGSGRFWDRISGPGELAPKDGEYVAYEANVQSKLSKAGNAYLSVWCKREVEAVDFTEVAVSAA